MLSKFSLVTLAASSALADNHGGIPAYTASELLSPCQEADNDASWGEAAEAEFEQYVMGFVDALNATGGDVANGICVSETNTADEVRWAFMRWVHESYSARTAMAASDAMLETLKSAFPCQQLATGRGTRKPALRGRSFVRTR